MSVIFESATIHQRLCTGTWVTFNNGDYSFSYSSITREAVHSNSWNFSTFWKFSQHIAYTFRTTRSFLSNFETLTKVSNISIFLRMRKLLLLATTYYLQVSYHDMKLKRTLGMPFHK